MTDSGRKLAHIFWAADRMLGSQRRPTRFQRFSARHPLGVGLAMGAPVSVVFAAAALPDGSLSDAITGEGFGIALGGVYGFTALGERYRQRRLLRLGLWDGS